MNLKFKSTAAALLTLLVVAAGLLMPQAVFMFQDKKIEIRLKNERYDNIIGKPATIGDKIKLIKSGNSSSPLESGVNMDAASAMKTAEAELKKLLITDYTFDKSKVVSVYLASSPDNNTMAVFWSFEFISESGSLHAVLDDETGKIISFSLNGPQNSATLYDGDKYAVAEKLINSCADYYGFDVLDVDSKKSGFYSVTYKFKNETINASVYIDDSFSYSFN